MKRAEKVERLLDVATELFNRDGFHGSGIDQIIAESGVAKTTMYRHFKSKEDLIVAVLQRIDARYREGMREAVEKSRLPSEDKLLATFDFLDSWFSSPSFFGCPFISAGSEYSDPSSMVFGEARSHKELTIDYFEELAKAAGLKTPKKVAREVFLLHEGATAAAHILGVSTVAREAKACAKKLLSTYR